MDKPVSVAKKLTVNDMKGSVGPIQNTEKADKKSSKSTRIIIAVMTSLLVVAIGFGGFMYWKYRDISSDPSSAISEKNQAETDRVLGSLKKALLVTETDAPTVARVEEPDKLKKSNQEFYKDIQKGDYLVIFPKRAIIYRESNDQIINVAPIINTADLKTSGTANTGAQTNEE